MRAFIAVLFLALSSLAVAEDVYVDATLASYHFSPSPEVNNERNYGLGLTFQVSEHQEFRFGFYKNSYSKQSGYFLYNFYNQHSLGGEWSYRYGLGIGAVSGYRYTSGYRESFDFADHKLQFGVLPSVSLGYGRIQATIGVLPEAATLQIQYRLP